MKYFDFVAQFSINRNIVSLEVLSYGDISKYPHIRTGLSVGLELKINSMCL